MVFYVARWKLYLKFNFWTCIHFPKEENVWNADVSRWFSKMYDLLYIQVKTASYHSNFAVHKVKKTFAFLKKHLWACTGNVKYLQWQALQVNCSYKTCAKRHKSTDRLHFLTVFPWKCLGASVINIKSLQLIRWSILYIAWMKLLFGILPFDKYVLIGIS